MKEDSFDTTRNDSQGTVVVPISPKNFDLTRYMEYEAELLERTEAYWKGDEGVHVYRRFRVPEVFSYGCKDMKKSLPLQLGALSESMSYAGDIANFLEPWYGIGVTASAFGAEYRWEKGQAPATEPLFSSIQEALRKEPVPVEKTNIGTHVLEMIEYFLDQTKGKIPISLTDTQSPFNVASYLIDTTSLFMSPYDCPGELKTLLEIITRLSTDFVKKQIELIGHVLASPGHGFASSRVFRGLGMSDDNMMMLSPEQYMEIEVPVNTVFGNAFGGPVFHSCGNWSGKIEAVKTIEHLLMVDGAFTKATDPDPNPASPFNQAFSGTGIIVNARMVGDTERVLEKVRELWSPGMKLIVVTYCETKEQQQRLYNEIHSLCS